MADGFDNRLITVSIEIDGQLKKFSQPMYITATGTKYANPLQNEAMVTIANLTKSDRDYLMTAVSPFNANRTSKKLIIEAGYESTGLGKIYEGNIVSVKPSQPPDIKLEFKCQTGQFIKGKLVSNGQPGMQSLKTIAGSVASQAGLELNFQATDKQVANYQFTGGALKQIEKLSSAGAVSAFQDDNQLVVKDIHLPLTGPVRILSKNSGMIGIPEVTEFGVKVTYLMDNTSKLGGALDIQSELYPALNGHYQIFKLSWNIASREVPFYWVAETIRLTDTGAAVIPAGIKKKKKKK